MEHLCREAGMHVADVDMAGGIVMPNVSLTEMDLAVIECLHTLGSNGVTDVQPPDLVSCLRQRFPEYDEVAMREGESLTRLRGRQLVDVDGDGRVTLTSLGIQMAKGLQ